MFIKSFLQKTNYLLGGILLTLMVSLTALNAPVLARDIEDMNIISGKVRRASEKSRAHGEDWEIKQNIETELRADPFVESNNITITVENGVATLTGTVENFTERAAAEVDAYQEGASEVHNHLKVRNGHAFYPPE
jgi:hypothetical protein